MRWQEIISEKLQQALPIRARTDSKLSKASPLIPAHSPIDPLASIIQQVAPMVGQAAQHAVALDDQEEEQVIAQILAQKSQGTQESMKDRESAKEIIKKKYGAR
jgi:hypothetical protein